MTTDRDPTDRDPTDSSRTADPAFAVTMPMTIQHATELRDRLADAIEAGARRFDLSAVEEFDSAGVQLLLAARRSLAARQAEIELAHVPMVVRDLLDRYGLQFGLAHTQEST